MKAFIIAIFSGFLLLLFSTPALAGAGTLPLVRNLKLTNLSVATPPNPLGVQVDLSCEPIPGRKIIAGIFSFGDGTPDFNFLYSSAGIGMIENMATSHTYQNSGTYQIGVRCEDDAENLSPISYGQISVSSVYASPMPMPGAPEMIYPEDGQTLDLEGAYMFKVKPVVGAAGYLFGLFQDGVMTYENYRDTRTLSANGEFALWPENPAHAKFHTGAVNVMIRALVNNQWTDARQITIYLKPRSGSEGESPVSSAPVPTVSVSVPLPTIEPPTKIVVVADSSTSAALEQKINNLQKQLNETKQKQAQTESKLNFIIAWLRSVFHSFGLFK